MIASILQWVVDAVNSILSTVFFFLPESPFADALSGLADNEVLQYVNWFIPIGTMLSITVIWLGAIATFYAYQIIMRWIKAIAD